jgi:hypothetical protein
VLIMTIQYDNIDNNQANGEVARLYAAACRHADVDAIGRQFIVQLIKDALAAGYELGAADGYANGMQAAARQQVK